MTFTLDNVVPWGRSFDEYVAMFALSENDLTKRFLGCCDGPASFNCTMTRRGGHVVSVDPIYRFSEDEIRKRIDESYEVIIEQARKNKDEFVWRNITSIEELGEVRMAAMNDFLSDYAAGLREGRYIDASLPVLPFKDGESDIALCSHFLFLYSEHLSEDFHVQSIEELCRVASEARIFPLLELGARRSRHLDTVLKRLEKAGLVVTVEKVDYEFQKGGNEMLRIGAA
jgi:hypothetical protein